MKFGSKLQFECPDQCPKDCAFYYDIQDYGQSALCITCPVFNLAEFGLEEEPLFAPTDFRDDWAAEWDEFFKTGKPPVLFIGQPGGNE